MRGYFVLSTAQLAERSSHARMHLLTPLRRRITYEGVNGHSAIALPGGRFALVSDEISGCPWGWMRILDVANPKRPRVVSEARVPPYNDTSLLRPLDTGPSGTAREHGEPDLLRTRRDRHLRAGSRQLVREWPSGLRSQGREIAPRCLLRPYTPQQCPGPEPRHSRGDHAQPADDLRWTDLRRGHTQRPLRTQLPRAPPPGGLGRRVSVRELQPHPGREEPSVNRADVPSKPQFISASMIERPSAIGSPGCG